MADDKDIYWATETNAEDLGSSLTSKVDDYVNWLRTDGRLWLWRQAYRQYYYSQVYGADIQKTGESGEFTSAQINQYRNLLLHLKSLALQQRPIWEPKAANSDQESMAQTILASSLLEYYMREKRIERDVEMAVERAIALGEGFVEMGWDPFLGEPYAVDPASGQVMKDGDVFVNVYTPNDVVRDVTKNNHKNNEWLILRGTRNKWNLIARYPALREQILGAPPDRDDWAKFNILDTQTWKRDNTDDLVVFRFYHKRTEAMPEGKYVEFLADGTILMQNGLPYKRFPVFRVAPEEQIDTNFGHSVAFDLLPIQSTYQALSDTILSNQAANGVSNIGVPRGSGINTQAADGLRIIEFDPASGPPVAINLTNTPQEIFQFQSQVATAMETISGINSVTRGTPNEVLKGSSGAAFAFFDAKTTQFASGLMKSYAELLEDMGSCLISVLQEYAQTPRIALIVGKSKRQYLKSYTNKDINLIQRVAVDVGSAATRTLAGRIAQAEGLANMGLIKTPEQFMMVQETGRIEPVMENEQAKLMLIKSENESLMDGVQVQALIYEDHKTHILEHSVVLANVDAKANPAVVMAVTTHIQQHIDLAKMMDPFLVQMLGYQFMAPLAVQAQTPEGATQSPLPEQPQLPKPPSGTDPNTAAIIEGEQQQ